MVCSKCSWANSEASGTTKTKARHQSVAIARRAPRGQNHAAGNAMTPAMSPSFDVSCFDRKMATAAAANRTEAAMIRRRPSVHRERQSNAGHNINSITATLRLSSNDEILTTFPSSSRSVFKLAGRTAGSQLNNKRVKAWWVTSSNRMNASPRIRPARKATTAVVTWRSVQCTERAAAGEAHDHDQGEPQTLFNALGTSADQLALISKYTVTTAKSASARSNRNNSFTLCP